MSALVSERGKATLRSWQSMAKATENASPLQHGTKKTSEHQRWFEAAGRICPGAGAQDDGAPAKAGDFV
jgi:hypothetical protein